MVVDFVPAVVISYWYLESSESQGRIRADNGTLPLERSEERGLIGGRVSGGVNKGRGP